MGAVIPLIDVGRERRGNLIHGSLDQNLDGVEEIGKVPRTVVFQVPWDLGLPEEDDALRPVRQRVTTGVVLQVSSPGHICKLQQCLVALAVQFVDAIVEVTLVLKLADMLVSLSQDINEPQASLHHGSAR